jgi:hypothetical protein
MRIRAYLCRRSPGARDLAIAAASLAAAMIVYAPPVYVWLDRVAFRRPNASELAGHLAMVASAWAATAMVSRLVSEGPTVRRLLTLCALATAAGMTAVFLSHEFPVETSNFTAMYGGTDAARLYWAIFLTYAIVLLSALCVLTAGTPIERQPWLRRGLRLVGIGSGLGVVYLLHWALELHGIRRGRPTPPWFGAASHAVGVGGSVLIGIGTTLPTLGPKVRAAIAIHRLRPMWDEATSEYPNVRVRAEPGDDRLIRLIAEIRDAATEARMSGRLDSDLFAALNRLPPHDLIDFDEEIRQLEDLARARSRRRQRRSES